MLWVIHPPASKSLEQHLVLLLLLLLACNHITQLLCHARKCCCAGRLTFRCLLLHGVQELSQLHDLRDRLTAVVQTVQNLDANCDWNSLCLSSIQDQAGFCPLKPHSEFKLQGNNSLPTCVSMLAVEVQWVGHAPLQPVDAGCRPGAELLRFPGLLRGLV